MKAADFLRLVEARAALTGCPWSVAALQAFNPQAVIRKKGSKWIVYSEKGKKLGEYDTKEEAEKRLRQIEWHKSHPDK